MVIPLGEDRRFNPFKLKRVRYRPSAFFFFKFLILNLVRTKPGALKLTGSNSLTLGSEVNITDILKYI